MVQNSFPPRNKSKGMVDILETRNSIIKFEFVILQEKIIY